ncbi:MAG: radical SAM protein [Thermodesulfobacteriota bacterium]
MTLRLLKKPEEILVREKGTIYKKWGGRLKVALIYPNTYSVGMSNLGCQSIYLYLNQLDYVVCERSFLPDSVDIPLFSLESQTPLYRFDVLAFSISFEEDYLNIPNILTRTGIPVLSNDRKDGHPVILAGGVATFLNPEPIAGFIDLFALGEGEELITEIFPLIHRKRSAGTDKEGILRELTEIEGVYVPKFYTVSYSPEGTIRERISLHGLPERVKKRRVENLDSFSPPSPVLTPGAEFSNMSLLEVSRGCPRGCRFCAAGFIYRPPRKRGIERLKEAVIQGINRGARTGLLGTSVSEHPFLDDLLNLVKKEGGEASISSLRIDTLNLERLRLLKSTGYRTITMAIETGSERLMRVINKSISRKDILSTIDMIKESGIRRVKLYYMIGLPAEMDEDIDALIELSLMIRDRLRGGTFIPRLTLSINPFVPKPWTPFQWYPLEEVKALKGKVERIKKALGREPNITAKFASPRIAYTQALLSLGDRRIGSFILRTLSEGKRDALEGMTPPPEFFVYRHKDIRETLPWDFIDHGIDKGYLVMEYKNGIKGLETPACEVESCVRCGVCGLEERHLWIMCGHNKKR